MAKKIIFKLVRKFLRPRAARATRPAKKAIRKAGRYSSLILVIIFAGLMLISLFLPKSEFQILKEKLIKNPNDFEAHLGLAEIFLANNQFEEAERMLRLVEQIPNSQKAVLGEQTSSKAEELWQKKHYSDPKDIRRLIVAWEKIVKEKPDYRDGWLQLAVLNYKIFENEKAEEYLKKVLELDPNFEPARELERIIQK